MTQVEPPRELAFLDALPLAPQHVWHDNSFELSIRGAAGIGRDDLEVNEFQKAQQKRSHAEAQFSVVGERTRVVADDGVNDALPETGNVNRDAGLSHGESLS
jgi:hypothetical protein